MLPVHCDFREVESEKEERDRKEALTKYCQKSYCCDFFMSKF